MSTIDALTQHKEAEPEQHAYRLLSRHGLSVSRVVAVDVDSVLYITQAGHPRTAWLDVRDGALVIHDEPGFSIVAPPTPA